MSDEVVVEGRRGHRSSATTSVGGRSRRATGEDGAVTAEAAMVLPLLVAFAMGLVWVLAVAVAQVRLVDGARETVRAAARGDSDGSAVAEGRQVAPAGARFRLSRAGDQVRVSVSVEVRGPGGLFSRLPGLHLTADAVAAEEPR